MCCRRPPDCVYGLCHCVCPRCTKCPKCSGAAKPTNLFKSTAITIIAANAWSHPGRKKSTAYSYKWSGSSSSSDDGSSSLYGSSLGSSSTLSPTQDTPVPDSPAPDSPSAASFSDSIKIPTKKDEGDGIKSPFSPTFGKEYNPFIFK